MEEPNRQPEEGRSLFLGEPLLEVVIGTAHCSEDRHAGTTPVGDRPPSSELPIAGLAARTALGRDPALIETILTGGDDYEIVAAVPARKVETLRRAAAAVGVPVREIGKVVAGKGGARFLDRDGKPRAFARPSFSHF